MEINGIESIDAVQRISSENPALEEEISREDQVVTEEIREEVQAEGIGQRVDIFA